MNSGLALRLLQTVMNWDGETEGPDEYALIRTLGLLADYKYNTYQQYAAGGQFIESLALWLDQFEPEDRIAALKFVHDRVIFISDPEMRHLVDLTFRNVVQPILRSKVSEALSLPLWRTAAIEESDEYGLELQRSLFLGLSDGARIDELRRSARLHNDQVHATHELQTDRAHEMSKEAGGPFRNIFLVDDFYGSGKSVIRWQQGETWLERYEPGAVARGRLVRFLDKVRHEVGLRDLFSEELRIHICLYVATEQALQHIVTEFDSYSRNRGGRDRLSAQATMLLDDRSKVVCDAGIEPFDALLHKHYRNSLMNEHRAVGGSEIVHGFSNGRLPLVFPHNTPNNTVYLLWETRLGYTALFPRVERHRPGAG